MSKARELSLEAKRYLQGRWGEAFAAVGCCLLIWLVLHLAELLLLLVQPSLPRGLILAGRILLGFVLTVPFLTGAFWWFRQAADGERNAIGTIRRLYTSKSLCLRAAVLFGWMWVVLLVPAFFMVGFGAAALRLFQTALTVLHPFWYLFAALQCAAGSLVLFGAWLWLLSGIFPAPLLFMRTPEKSPFALLRDSLHYMEGQRSVLAGLLLSMLPLFLPMITIPFALPRFCMSTALLVRRLERGELES